LVEINFSQEGLRGGGTQQGVQQLLVNAEREELEKLAKLSGSDSRDKIGTFVDIALPTVCELKIRYTFPIHCQETSTTIYLFVLHSVRSKDDFLSKPNAKLAYVFNNKDDDA
jgi:hypothetical protein